MNLRFRYGLCFLLLLLLMLGAGPQAFALSVNDVRIGLHPDKTRLVLDMSEVTKFRTFVLADPWRLVIDLPTFDWQVGRIGNPVKSPVGAVKQGTFQPGISRIVIDLKDPVAIRDAFLLHKPDRLVIDFTRITPGRFAQDKGRIFGLLDVNDPPGRLAAPAKSASPRPAPPVAAASVPAPGMIVPDRKPGQTQTAALSAPSPAIAPPRRKKPVIVIDAGHGGVDPGAIGPDGIFEKHVALGVARELKKTLDATGRYDVRLTRDKDVYLRLAQRVALARQHEADLFISLHADSIGKATVAGASVYTLSEKASDEQTARLADRENKADILAGTDLSHEDEQVAGILIDIAMRDTMNQSNFFAGTLVKDLEAKGINILERPHRSAGFAVLKAPDIPSVLVEMGFMSNKTEAHRLSTPSYRRKVAKALASGINAYFEKVARESRI